MERRIDAIVRHIRVLNHSSEKMAEQLGEVTVRMARLETNQTWLMRLVWVILSGIVALLIDMFS